jgi:predicted phosphoadenosine phosphosulfate sulfurtransferase
MPKLYFDEDVLTAAQKRISWTFDNFPKVYVSFSAGKDSTVMLHLVEAEARKRNRRFGLLLIDLEGQYEETIKHAEKMFADLEDITDQYWVCLPIALRNAVSVYQPKWKCWEQGKEDVWIRPLPSRGISDLNYFPFFHDNMEFEEFVPLFGDWYSQGEMTACLVGIRADESLNRYRTIASKSKEMFHSKQWSSMVTPSVANIYPIYDWRTEDIWTWHGKNPAAAHNRLYDLMNLAGLKISQMRICQPYGDDQRRGLWLFHLIEPQTWARVVARVNGANGGALYVQEWGNINGYRKITKPEGHTWRSFAEMLIASMPPQMEEHYRNKVLLFEKWWGDQGYPEGIPDEADYKMEAKRLAPSWRRVCKSLLRNDYWCKGLGFSQHKSEAYVRYLELMRKRKAKWNISENSLGYAPEEFQFEAKLDMVLN